MTPRIVYLSWPAGEISGGIKMVYRHVEVLRAAGFNAVVATPDGVVPHWFETSVPTTALNKFSSQDVLVFPENHPGMLETCLEWKCLKVVFCQNQFMVHRGLNGRRCYRDFGVSEIITVGMTVADYCQRRFPELPTSVIPVFIDEDLFKLTTHKRLQIAYTPRKRPMEAEFIKDLFRAEHPQWSDVPWIPIVNRPEAEVARILMDSSVYLALCRFEACPLTILEAFSCGCVVAGFTGFGARDYTTAANGFWAEEDDCLDCTTQLARALHTTTQNIFARTEMVSASVRESRHYSKARFEGRLLRYWRGFLERHAKHSAPSPTIAD